MSILDKVSEVFHPGSSNYKALLLAAINQFGGIRGLLTQFKEKGLGDVTQGWMEGKGLDKLTTAQVDQVFGNEAVQRLAEKVGLPPQAVSEQVSKFLPTLVHHLSADGRVPEGSITEEQLSAGLLDRVKGMFRKSA